VVRPAHHIAPYVPEHPEAPATDHRNKEPDRTITPTILTRAAGVAAVASGLIFIGVQIGHPHLDATTITSTEVVLRGSLKVLMAVLALVGITGMYLSQVRRNGLLGLIGYLVFSVGYLTIMCTTFVAAFVLPSIADTNPGFVNDVTTVATGGSAIGDIGALQTADSVQGFGYLAGGLIFGIALYRARVLTRWATVLLAVGGVVSILLTVLPDAFYRLLAFPTGIAMIGLGYSLWRTAGGPRAGRTPGEDRPGGFPSHSWHSCSSRSSPVRSGSSSSPAARKCCPRTRVSTPHRPRSSCMSPLPRCTPSSAHSSSPLGYAARIAPGTAEPAASSSLPASSSPAPGSG
jgi:hypothetical protein